MSPTVGKKCSCGYVHLARSLEEKQNLKPSERLKIYWASHRLFESSYYGTLQIPSKKIYLEFYDKIPITLREAPKEEVPEEPEPEKRQESFYGKTPYEKEQLLDEDNYADW